MSRRSERTESFTRGAVTNRDWDAICRTLREVEETFGGLPRPGLIVEVGTLGGKTTKGILEVLESLDWQTPDVATIDTDLNCLGRRLDPCRRFKNILRTFHGRSTDWGPIEPIWWVFIDGCHCHDCVFADLMHLSPHVPAGGVICLHDAGKQRERGMLVHERYHGKDGIKRLYGVTSAIDEWLMSEENTGRWERIENVPAMDRKGGAPTPLFGGLQAFRRK